MNIYHKLVSPALIIQIYVSIHIIRSKYMYTATLRKRSTNNDNDNNDRTISPSTCIPQKKSRNLKKDSYDARSRNSLLSDYLKKI